MRRWTLIPILVLACAGAKADPDLYRWVDAQGKVHYSDQLPPANIKQFEKKKAAGGKPSDAPLPYVLQQAVNKFPVTLYSTDCGEPCAKARELLAKRGVPYTEMDATVPAAQVELKKITGGPLEVPVLKVGTDALRGFAEGKWNTSLDAAGYPQTAMIPPRAPTKPKPAKPSPASRSDLPSDEASASPASEATQ